MKLREKRSMPMKLLVILLWLTGLIALPALVSYYYNFALGHGWLQQVPDWVDWVAILGSAGISGIACIWLVPLMVRGLSALMTRIEAAFAARSGSEVIALMSGLLFGLCVAALISYLFSGIELSILVSVVRALIYVFCAVLFMRIFRGKGGEIARLFTRNKPGDGGGDKVVDTSAIIDGRLLEVIQAGFVEGRIVVPDIVLTELRHIADSPDPVRRGRGRKALEDLAVLQQDAENFAVMDAPAGNDNDDRILRLALGRQAKVITTDYNLNQAASVMGVRVLNLNALGQSVKVTVAAGEEMAVQIVREGNQDKQGVAYLPDGTMVVVEAARDKVGQNLRVVVTGTMQTAAGRLVFARPL